MTPRIIALLYTTLLLGALVLLTPIASATDMTFSCREDNDLYQMAVASGYQCVRFDTPKAAVESAEEGAAVLILAQTYPETKTPISLATLELAARKHQRLFVEYPSVVPGISINNPEYNPVRRAVISSGFFGESLPELRVLAINGMSTLEVPVTEIDAKHLHIVSARVAGFDRAVFGLPEEIVPLLFEIPDQNTLVCTTKMSRFIAGRYAPQDAWQSVWQAVFAWLMPDTPEKKLSWELTVVPQYGPDEILPADYERETLQRGAEWFFKSQLLIPETRLEELKENWIGSAPRIETPPADAPVGDGTQGIMEAPLSIILEDGNQIQSTVLRSDCNTESAMALAFAAQQFNNPKYGQVAENLTDFIYFDSTARKGDRANPDHPTFGTIAWGVTTPSWSKANYGDDNARVLLSTMAVAGLTGEDRWNEGMAQCVLANLRTTGQLGFRHSRIDQGPLSQNGWEHYFRESHYHPSPHFQCYIWACYLWAYHQTKDPLLLDRAKQGLQRTMDTYPEGIHWTNGLAQERARILLPLAWLVRAEDTPENRAMFDQAVDGLLSIQAPCGAIREEIGNLQHGSYPPSQSNEAYGTNEASLIQQNGDPVSDMLYTTNFALLALHEAAYASDDPKIKEAEDRLTEFLCRIQIKSDEHPFLDGGWFRAFDFERWEFWGSNADHGWGAWSIESGWTCGWINAVLAMRADDTSLWDIAAKADIREPYAHWRPAMIPDDTLQSIESQKVKHQAVGRSARCEPVASPQYAANGTRSLTDGKIGPSSHTAPTWLGWLGSDVELVIDLGQTQLIQGIEVRCLESIEVGIFLPSEITFETSIDGTTFQETGDIQFDQATEVSKPELHSAKLDASNATSPSTEARYIRIRLTNSGPLPDWHRSSGVASWLFVDEVLVNRDESK